MMYVLDHKVPFWVPYQICGKLSMYLFIWSWKVLIPSNGVEVIILCNDGVVLVWTTMKVGNKFG
jgi:hypothetical protein